MIHLWKSLSLNSKLIKFHLAAMKDGFGVYFLIIKFVISVILSSIYYYLYYHYKYNYKFSKKYAIKTTFELLKSIMIFMLYCSIFIMGFLIFAFIILKIL